MRTMRATCHTLFTMCVSLFLGPTIFAQTCSWSKQIDYGLPIKKMVDGSFMMYSNAVTGYLKYPICTIEKMSHYGRHLWSLELPQNIAVICLTSSPDSGFYAAGTYTGSFSWNDQHLDSCLEGAWVARF